TDSKKAKVVEGIKQHFKNTPGIVDIDGIRIPFENGWALVRSSNTQPVIVLRFEAASVKTLNKIRGEVEALLHV
ncbi:MAG TPA: phosphomannomutase, partial [Smithella sp.]|nr:phosphomannomutase [Smithella sp.]